MPSHELTITLVRSGRLSVETLTQTLENALEMLRSLEPEFVESGTAVRWEVVRVRMRSPLRVTVAPNIGGKGSQAVARKLVKTCLKGVERIERTAVSPEHFNEAALDAARKLFEVTRKEGAALTFSSNHRDQVTLTEQAARHIDEIVAKARHYLDYGTIEGRLEVISVHDHPSFSIWESLTNRRVECQVSEEQIPAIFALLGKRVAVTGRVRYRNHVPKSIQVESLRKLRDDTELPDLQDIGPVNITEGLSSEEHVRRIRNG
jgi:molybdopterin-guanine dinucleotide biosynthesis protein